MNILRPDTENHFFAHIGRKLRLHKRNPVLAEYQHKAVAFLLHNRLQEVHLRRTDETSHKLIAGIVVQILGRIHLLNDAVLHYHNPVPHGHGFRLVMGDIDKGGLKSLVKRGNLASHLRTQLGVQIGQRLIQQEYRRIPHHSAAQSHTLSLSA